MEHQYLRIDHSTLAGGAAAWTATIVTHRPAAPSLTVGLLTVTADQVGN